MEDLPQVSDWTTARSLLVAHSCFTDVFICCLLDLLVVQHAASSGAVHTLASIHAILLEVLGDPSPGGRGDQTFELSFEFE